MAPLTWSLSERIDAPPDVVYAWMTDLTTDDHASEAFLRGAGATEKERKRPATRRIVSRDGDKVVLEDQWGRNKATNTVHLDRVQRAVRIDAAFGYKATWRAVPDGEGTRIEVEGKVAPKFPLNLLTPLFARPFRRQIERDFRGHVEDLREATSGRPR